MSKRHFNFRVLTKKLDNSNSVFFKNDRIFGVYEVHYEDDKPTSYSEDALLIRNWDSIKDLQFTVDKLQHAFSKPILDIDNWPNEFVDDSKARELGDALLRSHTHAELLLKFDVDTLLAKKVLQDPNEIVYREKDLIAALVDAGFPVPIFNNSDTISDKTTGGENE